jgi:hypothetical protein
VALLNKVKALEKSQRQRTERIRMQGGTTKAECERSEIATYIDKITGMVVHCSEATLADRAKAEKAWAQKASIIETAEERLARLTAAANKPYYMR